MRKCPLGGFRDCIGACCPLYNMRIETCVLPRVALSLIRLDNKSEKNEENDETERKDWCYGK